MRPSRLLVTVIALYAIGAMAAPKQQGETDQPSPQDKEAIDLAQQLAAVPLPSLGDASGNLDSMDLVWFSGISLLMVPVAISSSSSSAFHPASFAPPPIVAGSYVLYRRRNLVHEKDQIKAVRKTKVFADLAKAVGEDAANDFLDDVFAGLPFEALVQRHVSDPGRRVSYLEFANQVRPEIRSLLTPYFHDEALRERMVNIVVAQRATLMAAAKAAPSEEARTHLENTIKEHKAAILAALEGSGLQVRPEARDTSVEGAAAPIH